MNYFYKISVSITMLVFVSCGGGGGVSSGSTSNTNTPASTIVTTEPSLSDSSTTYNINTPPAITTVATNPTVSYENNLSDTNSFTMVIDRPYIILEGQSIVRNSQGNVLIKVNMGVTTATLKSGSATLYNSLPSYPIY